MKYNYNFLQFCYLEAMLSSPFVASPAMQLQYKEMCRVQEHTPEVNRSEIPRIPQNYNVKTFPSLQCFPAIWFVFQRTTILHRVKDLRKFWHLRVNFWIIWIIFKCQKICQFLFKIGYQNSSINLFLKYFLKCKKLLLAWD